MFKKYKKPFFLIILLVAFAVIFVLIYSKYYIKPQDELEACKNKQMVWDKGTYLINKNVSKEQIIIRVEERNKPAWYETLLPIKSSQEQFTTCVRAVTKYPSEVENNPAVKEEMKNKSKGLVVSIGKLEPLGYTPFAHITVNMELYANKFKNESYNLDVAMQNIADNFQLTQKENGTWKIDFNNFVEYGLEDKIPFNYRFAQINNKDITPDTKLELISTDEGKNWDIYEIN